MRGKTSGTARVQQVWLSRLLVGKDNGVRSVRSGYSAPGGVIRCRNFRIIFKPWAYLVFTVSPLGVYFARRELQSLSNQDANGNENVKEQLVLWVTPASARHPLTLFETSNMKYGHLMGDVTWHFLSLYDKSWKSRSFLFPTPVPDFFDGRWSFPTNENPNLYRRGRRRWILLITKTTNGSIPKVIEKFADEVEMTSYTKSWLWNCASSCNRLLLLTDVALIFVTF